MELNARYSFVFTVIMFKESPWKHAHSAYFSCSCCFFIAKHLKIVLEHINEFVRLECFFNSKGNFINELFHPFLHVLVLRGNFIHFVDEIVGIVLSCSVYHSVDICLRLKALP